MCKVGYTATLGPTYAIKSFLRCQSQRRRVVVNTLSFCISPRSNFAANHFPHKLRAAIILMSFKSFSVQRRSRKTNLGGGWVRCVAAFFFFVMQIYLEPFFVWLKETNLQINHISHLNAARLDLYWAGPGNRTVLSLPCTCGGGRRAAAWLGFVRCTRRSCCHRVTRERVKLTPVVKMT